MQNFMHESLQRGSIHLRVIRVSERSALKTLTQVNFCNYDSPGSVYYGVHYLVSVENVDTSQVL